ncbi:MAG: hypothetical protein ACP5HW_00310 [Candidatus Micrarchaeia archaeon]
MKMLILSDIHYPSATLGEISRIIKSEKPSNLVLLGDNLELELFKKKDLAYKEFLSKLDKIFPLRKSIIMLGDNDYTYYSGEEIPKILDSFSPINKREYFVFRIGNMNFFHGNLEKSLIVEKIGYHFVKHVSRIHINIAPYILSSLVRFYFGLPIGEYLFLGHLHYLGILGKNVFCGTLGEKSNIFKSSLGYVTVEHKNFEVKSISLHHI